MQMPSPIQERYDRLRTALQTLHPAKQVALGYFSYMVIGWLLLCLPIMHQVSGLHVLDHLFMAMSALSTTGLTTISTADSYNFLGELVILLLIQTGGIGYMTFGSFLVLGKSETLPPVRAGIARTAFGLPQTFPVARFIRDLIQFTIIVEAIGALFLYGNFRNAGFGIPRAAWSAIFHSVSAFCTAGFSLYNNSFESFAGHLEINLVIAALSILGAIGFIVWTDVWGFLNLRRSRPLSLTSKIILSATGGLILVGTILLFVGEPTIRALPAEQQLLAAFFQAMTAQTTVGFNTIPIAPLSKATVLLITVLMVIGASPAGTGGGLKSTTFATIIGVILSLLRGHRELRFWKQPVSMESVMAATASLGLYVGFLLVGTYFLEMTQTSPFDQNLFEAASALGPVGLSLGITSSLTPIGKLIIIALMYSGRLGPVTFGIALVQQRPPEPPSSEPTAELVV
jgi:trk system potassium uptake protein TrkH